MNIDQNIEKIFLLLILGINKAINENLISLDEAEYLLYSPYVMGQINLITHSHLLDLIHRGTELEDIQQLVPDHFQEAIDQISLDAESTLKALPVLDPQKAKWVIKLFEHS